jgi:alpha-beta hydrolase superfamily lysophospholipase
MLAAPWLGLTMPVPLVKRMLAPILGTVWPTLALGSGIRVEDMTRDPGMQARIAGDPLIHHVATARWFNEARAAQAHILANAVTLRVPTHIALPGDDRIAATDTTRAFAQAAGPVVEITTTAGGFHELFLEPERDQIVNDLVSWVVARLNSRIIDAS